ncbi:hypothetical protein [Azospirillum endophyticum]
MTVSRFKPHSVRASLDARKFYFLIAAFGAVLQNLPAGAGAAVAQASSAGEPLLYDNGVTDLQEAVLGLLEKAGIPSETNDRTTETIGAAECARQPIKPFSAMGAPALLFA